MLTSHHSTSAPEHVQTEQALKNSGLDYTILRNGWYSENYTGSIAPALGLGAFMAVLAKVKFPPRLVRITQKPL